jgi:hypothetical protein
VTADSVEIYGAGTVAGSRKVKIFDNAETANNLTVGGNLNVTGTITATGIDTSGGAATLNATSGNVNI